MDIKIGQLVPAFKLLDADKNEVSLKDFRGKTIVLYFYPKDNTSGCTREVCDFSDAQKKFSKKNVLVIGISPDKPSSHVKFREKYDLPFLLLSDPEKQVAKLYVVLKKKNMYGKDVIGIGRSTFIIDKNGKLRAEFRGVKVDEHVEEVLASLG
ncbi:MAG: peroxiredoxin [Deltaproteobacteria bacterium]|nr:peroxiredoxin [Deltaproteobacteria bacterium]